MEFNLHPVAVKAFNEEALRLYKKLNCYPICISKKEENSFRPDYFISSNLTEKDIVRELKSSTTNWIGDEVAISFYYKGKRVELCQLNYKNLVKLSESIQRVPQLSPFVSVSFIKNAIFNWMRGKYLDELSCGMIEYVVQLCEKEVVESEIWIPLTHTHIQSEIKIGKIILNTITKELLNEWIDKWDINSEIRERSKKEFMDQYQEMLQGIAAATICLYAEPQRANEIAAEEAEKAASILRIFSPGVCHPKIISCCTPIGTEHIKINRFFQIKNNKILRITEEMTNNPWIPWILKNEFIDMIRNKGLDILSDVLLQKNKKDFQSQVLNSLFIYSRCALAIDVEDKLIYILVAIESVLLKNDGESIQQNIGERMAILVERTAEKRKQVIKNVKEVYAARSGFIHHGRTIDETESIATFMFNSHRFFQILIMDINKFENKLEFIEKIEEIKLSWSGT